MPNAPDSLTLHAKLQSDKLAVIEDPQPGQGGRQIRWTFGEFNQQVNRLANALLDLGVKREDKLLWCGPNSGGVLRVVHAARKIGASAVPLNYRLTPEEAAYVIENSDAIVAYIDPDMVELFASIRADVPKLREVLVFDGAPGVGMKSADDLIAAASPEEPDVAGAAQAAETIIYTSGTTGKPKGATRRGGGDPEQTKALIGVFGYQPDDVYLTTGPLYHSGPGGFCGIAHALGNTVVIQRKYDAEDWLRLISEFRVTSSFAAPTPVRMACNLSPDIKARYDTSSMKRFIANAAPWSWALKEAYLADFPEDSLFEVYGSTELGVNTILRPEDQRRKKGSCGKEAPGVELRLLDEQSQVISEPNQEGELFARSKSIFSSYYKAEEKYEADRRGDFHTVGDMAYFDDEGFFYICDRKNDMIISGGMNIYPAEIEAALELHDDVLDAAVFGIPSEEWGEAVHAIVVVLEGRRLEPDGVTQYAREHLASYKIPRSVSFLAEIPRNGSGKILKKELRAPFWQGHDRGVA
jgi:acyl-coenzyme A synthetase/AMP-(fatty) acid ligase